MWLLPLNTYIYFYYDATYHSIVNICLMFNYFFRGDYTNLITQPGIYYTLDLVRCVKERDTVFLIHHIASLLVVLMAWMRLHIIEQYTALVGSVMLIEFSGLLVNLYHLSDKTIKDRILLAAAYIPIRTFIIPIYIIFGGRVVDYIDVTGRCVMLSICAGSYMWCKKMLLGINDYIEKKSRSQEEVASNVS